MTEVAYTEVAYSKVVYTCVMDYYTLLAVEMNSSPEDIKAAYR